MHRRLLVVTVLAVVVAVLFLGNAFFRATDTGIQQTYRDSFTGEFSISTKAETPFTIFGSDLPLVGEYEVLPVLIGTENLVKALVQVPGVDHVVPQISAQAMMQLPGISLATPVFGVDFPGYFAAFPALKIVDGVLPVVADTGCFLNVVRRDRVEAMLGRHLVVGEPVQFVSTNSGGFSIREIPYLGAYAYPVHDDLLDRIVLVDPDTARALNGYVVGAARMVEVQSGQVGLLNATSTDELFGDVEDTLVSAGEGLDLKGIETELKQGAVVNSAVQTAQGSWNFLLVRMVSGTVYPWTAMSLGTTLSSEGSELQLRDWRGTAGGNAELVWFVRLVFNAGMLLVILIAVVVMANALSLSIQERTREIGTMRAIGARKSFVSNMILCETMLLVFVAGIVGVGIGSAGTLALHNVGIPIVNPFLVALFGGTAVYPEFSWLEVVGHLGFCIVIGLVSAIWPLRAVLKISPVHAMATEV